MNILGTTKKFRNHFLLQFNEKFLTWSSLTCDVSSKKSWFLCSDKYQVKESGDVIASKTEIQKQPFS